MKRLSLVPILAVVALWAAHPTAEVPAAQGRLVEIIATDAGGKYIFKPDTIAAKPAEQLLVRLKSVAGTMGNMPKMAMAHNFVLIKPGNDPMQFANAGIAGGFAGSYIAPDKKGTRSSRSRRLPASARRSRSHSRHPPPAPIPSSAASQDMLLEG